MTALLLSYIWLWQGTFAGDFYVCVAAYFAIGLGSHVARGESAASIGLRFDNFGRALIQVLIFIGPAAIVPPLVASRLPGPPPEGQTLAELVRGSLWLLPWSLAQQYGLLAFFYRRFQEVLAGHTAATLAAASAFALFHLPNPFLTAVTLGAGLLSCWLYRRVNNLWALGLGHALLSWSISHSLSEQVTFGMLVGPACWNQF
jgi:hypothetical protein